tara:strand:- start:308 stop:664 length:357 start_codon:yes stop_codon:yes gene_type:complete
MAWTAPKTWDETVVTAAMLNTYIRDEFLALDQHAHTGASGDGFSNLDVGGTYTGQTNMTLASNTEALTQTGELRRQGIDVRYFNGVTVQLSPDAAVSMPSARTLGTGATQAAAGNHTH